MVELCYGLDQSEWLGRLAVTVAGILLQVYGIRPGSQGEMGD